MKRAAIQIIILFLFVFTVISDSNFTSSTIDRFIKLYLYENETFTKSYLSMNGSDYYFVNINGKLKFIVEPLPEESKIVVVNDSEQIRLLLMKYYESNGISYSVLYPNYTEIEGIRNLTMEFNNSRALEGYCKRFIGLDRFECSDHITCWRACYTPICQTMKLGGGEIFINMVWSFSNLSAAIDGNLTYINNTLDLISSRSINDSYVFDEMINSINSIKNSSTLINKNGIFRLELLGFCPEIPYNQTVLEKAKSAVMNISLRIKPVFDFDKDYAELLNEAQVRIASRREIEEKEPLSTNITVKMEEAVVVKEEPSQDYKPLIAILIVLILLASVSVKLYMDRKHVKKQ